jgi:triacylglycerol lipase
MTDQAALTPKERLMCSLAMAAYCGVVVEDFSRSELALLLPRLGQDLVWGPAFHTPGFARPDDAMMYVCQSRTANEFTVVARGTNPFSLDSWISQDLEVAPPLLSWVSVVNGDQPPKSADPAQPGISRGAAKTVDLCTGLKPKGGYPGAGTTFFDFMAKQDSQATIDFAGHSLGGLAAPTLALWCIDRFPSWKARADRISVYAFAGPTAGNQAFANHSESVLNAGGARRCVRYINTLDVVPYGFADLESLKTIYGKRLATPKIIVGIIDKLQKAAAHNYSQLPQPSTAITEGFKRFPIIGDLPYFLAEIVWQHVMPYFDATLLVPGQKHDLLKTMLDASDLRAGGTGLAAIADDEAIGEQLYQSIDGALSAEE